MQTIDRQSIRSSSATKAKSPWFGQQSTTPFFQPKLTVNTPGDAYEQEADAVAERVMGMQSGEAAQPQALSLTPVAPVQRQCAECEGEEELQRKEEEGEEKEVQLMPMASSADDTIQRQCAACEQEEVQRKESGGGDASGKAAPGLVSDVLSSGGGQAMDGGTRQFMESRFGHDFGQVRIHTDSRAAESASAIQARAYTSGRDIVFGQGEYQPSSSEGQRLLAHELAHVGQQSEFIQRQSRQDVEPHQRFIVLDGSVLDQILRGNDAAAQSLRNLVGSARVVMSLYAYNEINTTPNLQTRTALQRIIDDLHIEIERTGGSRAQRVAAYTANSQTNNPIMEEGDLFVAAQARGLVAEIWGFDRVYRRNWRGVQKTLGVRVAPESYTIGLVPHGTPKNYHVARRLLGLNEIHIDSNGVVSHPVTTIRPVLVGQPDGQQPENQNLETEQEESINDSNPTTRSSDSSNTIQTRQPSIQATEDPLTQTRVTRPTGSIDSEGRVSVGGSQTHRTTFEDTDEDNPPIFESTRTTTGSLSYQQDEQGHNIGARTSHTRTTRIGSSESMQNASLGGSIHIDNEGHIDGGGANASVGVGNLSVNLGGNVRVTAQRPVLEDGRYIVRWEISESGSLGGGYERGSVGGSATYSGSSGRSGQRVFPDREGAMQFYNSRIWARLSLNNAEQLEEGESVSQTNGHQLGLGGNLNLEGISVGGSLNVGRNHTVEVTSLSHRQISVRITDDTILGVSGNIGAPGVGMSAGYQRTLTAGQIVVFDLSTLEGRAAFNYLRELGRLPSSGYTLTGNISGQTDEESSGITLGIGSASSLNTTSEMTQTDAQGQVTQEQRTGTESTSIRIPLVGNFSESHQIESIEDVRNGQRAYRVRTIISSSSTQDVNSSLAEATGHHMNTVSRDIDNQSSRRWEVSTSFTEAQIQRLVQRVRAGNFHPSLLLSYSGYGEEFASQVRNAGRDMDRVERALSEYVSETGTRGLSLLYQTIGITPRYDIRLIGDEFFAGSSWYSQLAQRILNWEERLSRSQDVRGIGSEIIAEIREQRRRLRAISNSELYPDLPRELRQTEIDRANREVDRLVLLRERALGTLDQHQPSTASESSIDALSQINQQERQVSTTRQRAIEHGNEARRHRWIQVEGAYVSFGSSALDRWGEAEGLIFSAGVNRADFERARYHFVTAENAWQRATAAWDSYENHLTEARNDPENSASAVSRLSSLLTNCFQEFASAERNYASTSEIYSRIYHQHLSEGRHSTFAAYTEGRTLPPERQLPSNARF